MPLREAKASFLDALGTFGVDYANNTLRQGRRRHVPRQRPVDRAGPGGTDESRASRRRRSRRRSTRTTGVDVALDGETFELDHGAVVIAAITSCTNTSNPQVMIAAGLLAKKRRRARPRAQAVGEVVARARLEGRDRVLRARRPDAVPRAARLPHGRLRLHDLHRQLRPAAGARSRPRSTEGDLVACAVLSGQPQLRGAHPSGGEGELPRLAAARRRLRARRPHGPRPDDRAARPGPGRRGRVPARPLAERRPRSRRRSPRSVRGEMFRRTYADVFTGDEAWRGCRCPRASSSPGRTPRPTCGGRRTSTA